MEIKQLFSVIRKRFWIIIILPLITSLAAAYISFYVLEPVYESNTTLYVINRSSQSQGPIAYSDLMASQYLVKDYRELVRSRTVTETVIETLDIEEFTPEVLAQMISVNLKNDTRIIDIKVQDSDPGRAKEIADKVGQVFIDKVMELMKIENVSVVDKAQIPQTPVKPVHYINIAAAFFMAFMVSVGLVFLIEYLDDTIKTSEDVKEYLDVTVLGVIPEFSLK